MPTRQRDNSPKGSASLGFGTASGDAWLRSEKRLDDSAEELPCLRYTAVFLYEGAAATNANTALTPLPNIIAWNEAKPRVNWMIGQLGLNPATLCYAEYVHSETGQGG